MRGSGTSSRRGTARCPCGLSVAPESAQHLPAGLGVSVESLGREILKGQSKRWCLAQGEKRPVSLFFFLLPKFYFYHKFKNAGSVIVPFVPVVVALPGFICTFRSDLSFAFHLFDKGLFSHLSPLFVIQNGGRAVEKGCFGKMCACSLLFHVR